MHEEEDLAAEAASPLAICARLRLPFFVLLVGEIVQERVVLMCAFHCRFDWDEGFDVWIGFRIGMYVMSRAPIRDIAVRTTQLQLIANAPVEVTLFSRVVPERRQPGFKGVVHKLCNRTVKALHQGSKNRSRLQVTKHVIMIVQ